MSYVGIWLSFRRARMAPKTTGSSPYQTTTGGVSAKHRSITSAQRPAPPHSRRPNTAPQCRASNSAAAVHKVASPAPARPTPQSDAPAPPRRHSHLPFPDSTAARASPQPPPPQTPRSAPPGRRPCRDPIRFLPAASPPLPPAPSSPTSVPRRSPPAPQSVTSFVFLASPGSLRWSQSAPPPHHSFAENSPSSPSHLS